MEPIDLAAITPDIYGGPFHGVQRAAGATFYEDYGMLWTRDFGDPVAEYWATRRDAVLWDISSLVKFRFTGRDALAALDRLTTRRVSGVSPGTVRYCNVLNGDGKMLDEATVLVVSPQEAYLFGNDEREPFLGHLARETEGLELAVENVTRAIPNIAVQGPRSFEVLEPLVDADLADLRWFRFIPEPVTLAGVRGLLIRAGFTGEVGYEFYMLDGDEGAETVWNAIAERGAVPIGLDGIEMLRVEAGLVIQEEDYFPGETDPYDLSMDAFIELEDHAFVGREACLKTASAPPRRFVTLAFDGDKVPAPGAAVARDGEDVGDVRSAEVTPRFGPIGLAVVDARSAGEGNRVEAGGLAATVRGLPIDDPKKRRPRSDPRNPLTVD